MHFTWPLAPVGPNRASSDWIQSRRRLRSRSLDSRLALGVSSEPAIALQLARLTIPRLLLIYKQYYCLIGLHRWPLSQRQLDWPLARPTNQRMRANGSIKSSSSHLTCSSLICPFAFGLLQQPDLLAYTWPCLGRVNEFCSRLARSTGQQVLLRNGPSENSIATPETIPANLAELASSPPARLWTLSRPAMILLVTFERRRASWLVALGAPNSHPASKVARQAGRGDRFYMIAQEQRPILSRLVQSAVH